MPLACPLLSIGLQRPPEESRLALPGEARPEPARMPLAPCIGADCGFFVPHLDASGRTIGGTCATVILASASANHLGTIASVVQHAAGLVRQVPKAQPPAAG